MYVIRSVTVSVLNDDITKFHLIMTLSNRIFGTLKAWIHKLYYNYLKLGSHHIEIIKIK